ncbi:MAG: peptidoglycan DD-metalloendopeptidase family protein [Epulopiscium sp.]|nr:peptidoglycan DD-metalloendopeptidase family protein [Candidatus Epulonipiscium sp.]
MINLQKIQSLNGVRYFRLFVLAIVVTTVFYLGFQISTQPNAYAVSLNEQQLGIIEEEQLAKDAYKEAELVIQEQIGNFINIHEEISLEPVHASKKDLITKEDLTTKVQDNITYDIQACVIKVDGEIQAILKDKEQAQEILEEIKKTYTVEGVNMEHTEFVEKVTIEPQYIKSLEETISKEKAISLLTKSTVAQKTYNIREGDSLWGIAKKYDMSIEDVLKANPDLEEESLLQIGQEIGLNLPKPMVSVVTKERFIYKEPIEKPVKYEEDDTQLKTYMKVIEAGEEGEKEITAYRIRINGYEESTQTISEEVIKEPKEAVIIVGTKTPPPKSATGTFRMPVSGKLSSGFGSRWGTFHAGIDLAAPQGTPIYASDGGVVTEAGWHGGYGYLVKVNHGNGFETYYAHTSKIYVTVGQKVAKGEKIAAVGSTGNSTGYHLHFEVRLNGDPRNPYNYLK